MNDPSLRDVRLFVYAVRQSSLSAASRGMGLSPNAASLAVKRLEQQLGVRLLMRTTRSISLTTEGKIYYEQCTILLDTVDATQNSVKPLRDELVGPVRVATPSDIGRQRILPMLEQFTQAHPRVTLDVWVSDELYNIVTSRIDVAIRYGQLTDSDFVTRQLYPDYRVAVASPSYLEKMPPIKHPKDLKNHKILVWQSPRTALTHWRFSRQGHTQTIEVHAHRYANDGVILRQWAIEGHGIVFKASLDVVQDIEDGTLVDVLPDWRGAALPLHLVVPSKGARPARVQRLIQTLQQEFKHLQQRYLSTRSQD